MFYFFLERTAQREKKKCFPLFVCSREWSKRGSRWENIFFVREERRLERAATQHGDDVSIRKQTWTSFHLIPSRSRILWEPFILKLFLFSYDDLLKKGSKYLEIIFLPHEDGKNGTFIAELWNSILLSCSPPALLLSLALNIKKKKKKKRKITKTNCLCIGVGGVYSSIHHTISHFIFYRRSTEAQ